MRSILLEIPLDKCKGQNIKQRRCQAFFGGFLAHVRNSLRFRLRDLVVRDHIRAWQP